MPGQEPKRNRTGTDPSLNHPLTMSYMGAGSGEEKRLRRNDFHPPLPGGGSRPAGARGGVYGDAGDPREPSRKCCAMSFACVGLPIARTQRIGERQQLEVSVT
jgi:hypothetical protein